MKIKKYDRFKWDDEIIEATGLTLRGAGEMLPVFKVVESRPGRAKDEIVIYDQELFDNSDFKKMPKLCEPLLYEIAEELKVNPSFGEAAIEFFSVILAKAKGDKRKTIFGWLQKHLPFECLATLETITS